MKEDVRRRSLDFFRRYLETTENVSFCQLESPFVTEERLIHPFWKRTYDNIQSSQFNEEARDKQIDELQEQRERLRDRWPLTKRLQEYIHEKLWESVKHSAIQEHMRDCWESYFPRSFWTMPDAGLYVDEYPRNKLILRLDCDCRELPLAEE